MSNEDKASPEVFLKLGDKTRTLCFSMYSMDKFQRLTGKNLLKGEIDTREPSDLIRFTWAALIDNHPELDGFITDNGPDEALVKNLEQVARWMTFNRLNEISSAVLRAYTNAMPPSTEGSGDEKK